MKSRLAPRLRTLARLLPRPNPLCRHISTSAAAYSTPLAKHLADAIKTNGPISLAVYMRQCLTSSSGGYYTTARTEGRDPFGRTGDFVTSPEISQMFGEMLGIWIVSEWMAQGRRSSGVQLVELGPGRGTLMSDVLRTLNNFPPLSKALDHIYLIEASPTLRATQRTLLCGPTSTPTAVPNGETCTTLSGHQVTWYESLTHVPTSTTTTPFILAHEFFDALPIHAFTSTSSGWRELLVTHNPPNSTHLSLGTPRSQHSTPVPEFALTQAKSATPYSVMLPELSGRYKALSKTPGNTIEVSPESLTCVEAIATRIGASRSGAALVIDYGPADSIPVNSLRGIQRHRSVSPFYAPGEVDVSADVDFTALAERAVSASERVEVHGPVEQGAFLGMLGMRERMEMLVRGLEGGEKEVVESGYRRLVERGVGGMGRIYKVMAVVPESGGRRPVGFGGGVVEE